MHCRDWEERLALHVGGDLPAAKAAEVERHLAECGPCQGFWSGMKESLELLEGIHAEPLPPACYTAVRASVMAELRARRAWWRRGWVMVTAGLAAAAVLMAVALTNWPGRRMAAPVAQVIQRNAVVTVPEAPSPAADSAPDAQAKPPQRSSPDRGLHHRRRNIISTPQPRQPLLVRLVTDDPDVVIYWIAD